MRSLFFVALVLGWGTAVSAGSYSSSSGSWCSSCGRATYSVSRAAPETSYRMSLMRAERTLPPVMCPVTITYTARINVSNWGGARNHTVSFNWQPPKVAGATFDGPRRGTLASPGEVKASVTVRSSVAYGLGIEFDGIGRVPKAASYADGMGLKIHDRVVCRPTVEKRL